LTNYSAQLKDSIVAKMLPPHNVSVPELVRETGIPRDTLYGWRNRALSRGAAAAAGTPSLGSWSSEEKFSAVVETASLNELEVGEYCRRKGIFPEQLTAWRETCRQANAALPSKAERAERRVERQQIQHLTRELAYKDRALAEAAALLVLQKNHPLGRPRPAPVGAETRPGLSGVPSSSATSSIRPPRREFLRKVRAIWEASEAALSPSNGASR
jgi:transposase